MKIIHTSDWHLGNKLYFWDRTDEETHFFNQLRKVVEEDRPDALLVSGDVFHTGTPGNDVAKSFTDHMLDVTSAAPQMETIIIAGNHDSYSRLVIDKALWKRCKVHIVGVPGEDASGLARFEENIITLPGKGTVAAVPFCHARNFPLVPDSDSVTDSGSDSDGDSGTDSGTDSDGGPGTNAVANPAVDRQAAYFAGLREFLRIHAQASLPVVLMAHMAVGRDTDFTGQDRGGVIGGEECVDVATLGRDYDYIALGHIHHPQWIGGSDKKARYCGTPRAIHFDETYDHGVDVIEVSAGTAPVCTFRKFEPMRKLVTVGGPKGLPFEEALKAFDELTGFDSETYVRLNVSLAADALQGADWTERARTAVAARGGRFCLVNPIRVASEKPETAEMTPFTMSELKELSNDEIAKILSQGRNITESQGKLLRDVIDEVCEHDEIFRGGVK